MVRVGGGKESFKCGRDGGEGSGVVGGERGSRKRG